MAFGLSAVSKFLIVLSGAALGGAVVTTATALTTQPSAPSFHQLAPLDLAPAPNQTSVGPSRPPDPAPVKLLIPRLKISAAVEALGVNQDYSLQAPAGISDVGWYRLGASPGFAGDAIISGHRGYPGGTPAVFNGISRLDAGDELDVELADGTSVQFAVTSVYTTSYHTIPAGFFATDGVPRLTLVTCTGDFLSKDLTYRDRLVVEAKPVAQFHQGEI
ncbi:MAG: class F sortase [Candidatus Dormibacteraceae bacterium]